MIAALATVTLADDPVRRKAKSGAEYVTATGYAADRDGQRQKVSLICWTADAGAVLIALKAGDQLAVTGAAKVSTFKRNSGEPGASVDIQVTQAMTMYALEKRRTAALRAPEQVPEFADDLPPWEA